MIGWIIARAVELVLVFLSLSKKNYYDRFDYITLKEYFLNSEEV